MMVKAVALTSRWWRWLWPLLITFINNVCLVCLVVFLYSTHQKTICQVFNNRTFTITVALEVSFNLVLVLVSSYKSRAKLDPGIRYRIKFLPESCTRARVNRDLTHAQETTSIINRQQSRAHQSAESTAIRSNQQQRRGQAELAH